jgi:hypothetical protein
MYPNLFSSYHPLKGSDWLRSVTPEDRQAFSRIGFQASEYGKKGGRAIVQKYGREHLSTIGRRGALVTNLKKWIAKRIEEETWKELGL